MKFRWPTPLKLLAFYFHLTLMLFEGNERKELERKMKDTGRLPPGQSLTLKWPVLHYGDVPRFDPQTWDFRVSGVGGKATQADVG